MYFPTGRLRWPGHRQSVIAASKTVGPSRLPHSVHGYFIAAGDIRQDLLFLTSGNLRDGRSFSARRVNRHPSRGSILTAIASFQETGQEGVEFADPMPENPARSRNVDFRQRTHAAVRRESPFANYYAEKSPFDIRHVTPTVMLRADKGFRRA